MSTLSGCGRSLLLASLLLGGVGPRGYGQAQNADAVKGAGAAGEGAEVKDAGRAKLISDTHRLLILSREVQAEMAKNGPETLSLGMVKKIEEMQKLAAKVKAEMAKTP